MTTTTPCPAIPVNAPAVFVREWTAWLANAARFGVDPVDPGRVPDRMAIPAAGAAAFFYRMGDDSCNGWLAVARRINRAAVSR
jgi:hypothetical protein